MTAFLGLVTTAAPVLLGITFVYMGICLLAKGLGTISRSFNFGRATG